MELTSRARRNDGHENCANEAHADADCQEDRDDYSPYNGTLLLDVVYTVQGVHDAYDSDRQIPDDERRCDNDQRGGAAREDLLGGVVDGVEDRCGNKGLDRRRDRVVPRVLEPERPEEAQAEEDERDESDDRSKGDRGGVDR
jgi:hypothetical protein